jgi:hypothetical protein
LSGKEAIGMVRKFIQAALSVSLRVVKVVAAKLSQVTACK